MKNKSVLITLKGAHLFFSLYAFFSQEQFFSWVPFLGISLLKKRLLWSFSHLVGSLEREGKKSSRKISKKR